MSSSSNADNPNNVIIINSRPPPVIQPTFTEEPTLLTCPYCSNCVTTRVSAQFGAATFLSIGCFATCCLCCLPCFLDQFKDMRHECPSCNSDVGTFYRIGH